MVNNNDTYNGDETNVQKDDNLQNAITVSCFFIAIASLYIVIVFSIHIAKVIKNARPLSKLSVVQKISLISKIVSLIIAILSVVRSISLILYINWPRLIENINSSARNVTANDGCHVLANVTNFSLTIGFGLVYLFLWLRQRILYIDPSLRSINSAYTNSTSLLIFLFWCLYYIILFICSYMFVRYKFDDQDCKMSDKMSANWATSMLYSWIATSVAMQLILLVLFVIPLVKQQSWRRQNNLDDEDLFKVIKKSIIFTAVSLLVDIISFILTLLGLISNQYAIAGEVQMIVYDFSLFMNALIVVLYFKDWKTIIWPLQRKVRGRLSQVHSKTVPNCVA